ncbi:uncharacterized protein BP5553_09132 [Venustampulla echinocandica]|uniref:Uncharacterized protein n=1 Tax=Venustampulla echinocandica TaxID=2656787 RepID=A0A370TDZ5_9HELO|nr:uncharacterized protein BP5553_09132 [Venustampulla echinocandica]RDL32676.1 hypothetical protein BP5553_09132 [Venustampulla echinocandica]
MARPTEQRARAMPRPEEQRTHAMARPTEQRAHAMARPTEQRAPDMPRSAEQQAPAKRPRLAEQQAPAIPTPEEQQPLAIRKAVRPTEAPTILPKNPSLVDVVKQARIEEPKDDQLARKGKLQDLAQNRLEDHIKMTMDADRANARYIACREKFMGICSFIEEAEKLHPNMPDFEILTKANSLRREKLTYFGFGDNEVDVLLQVEDIVNSDRTEYAAFFKRKITTEAKGQALCQSCILKERGYSPEKRKGKEAA